MEPFTTLSGTAAPLFEPNISTDALIPSREITSASRAGYGVKLFSNWRYSADGSEKSDFVLNEAAYRQARILIAGANFGCGSSREMAVWALEQFGIRCVIAPSYASIFRANFLRNGLLPVILPEDVVAQLARTARESPDGWTVDLERCEVREPGGQVHVFQIDAAEREQLLSGLDPIGLTLQHSAIIQAFAAADRERRPWIWRGA